METNIRVKKRKHAAIIASLFALTIITSVLCLFAGSVDISFGEMINLLIGKAPESPHAQIVYNIRLPRILLALAVGGGLSVAGAVFQAILINPLAEPYILGISSGGTFGVILSLLLGLSIFAMQLMGFAGALLVILIVFMLGKRFGELDPNTLLLTGVMVGAFFSALILLMITMLDDSLRTAVFWLIGNLSLAKPDSVYTVLPVSIVTSFILWMNGFKYNILSLGDENAKHLGVNTKKIKSITYITASVMVGSIVSVSGIIGFVGLLVPHVCRMLFGVDNRIIIPASFLIGASYLIIADTAARNIISPAELPVGAVTALLGAPVFIYLLRKRFYTN